MPPLRRDQKGKATDRGMITHDGLLKKASHCFKVLARILTMLISRGDVNSLESVHHTSIVSIGHRGDQDEDLGRIS